MSRRHCPGCCLCLILEDDFDRTDNTNLGSDWAEVLGDSDIFSNTLRIPAGGLVVTTYEHSDTRMVVYAKFPTTPVGSKPRIIVNYLDEDNYLFAELDIQSPNTFLSVNSRIGGVETDLAPFPGGYSIGAYAGGEITVCFSGTSIAATVAENAGQWACAPDTGGKKAGLGNGGSGSIQADDFSWKEHFYTLQRADCPKCLCLCEGYCISKTLTATFTATGGCFDLLDGFTISMTYDEELGTFDIDWSG